MRHRTTTTTTTTRRPYRSAAQRRGDAQGKAGVAMILCTILCAVGFLCMAGNVTDGAVTVAYLASAAAFVLGALGTVVAFLIGSAQ